MEGPENTVHHTYRSLKSIEADLPDFFIKVKQNTLVNGIKIIELDTKKREVTLKGGFTLPISYRCLKEVRNLLTSINKAPADGTSTHTP